MCGSLSRAFSVVYCCERINWTAENLRNRAKIFLDMWNPLMRRNKCSLTRWSWLWITIWNEWRANLHIVWQPFPFVYQCAHVMPSWKTLFFSMFRKVFHSWLLSDFISQSIVEFAQFAHALWPIEELQWMNRVREKEENRCSYQKYEAFPFIWESMRFI